MASKRADDPDTNRSWFRSDRLVEEAGQWYFLTREGTVEGPYDSKVEAMEKINLYARVMEAHLLSAETEAALKNT